MALLVGFMYHLLHIEIIRLLKKKRLDPHFSVPEINELNIYKLDPSELPGLSEIKSDEQVWSFFCEPDYKYANSKRANRKTGSGNWKITGKPLKVKDKTGKVIGSKKNLVYHKRVASKMVKTDWLMYEFSVKDSSRYKKDFVFCDIKKNPDAKSNISTSDDDQHQPSQSLASDAETYATEKASTEVVESQQPSTHGLRNNFLEVESEVQSNRTLVPDTGNNFVPNTSSMEDPQLLPNQNLGFDTRNNFADNYTSPVEVEPGLISNPNLVSDQKNPFIPIASSMVQTQSQSVPNLESDSKNQFVPNTSSMLQSSQNFNSDPGNHSPPCTNSSIVESELQSNHCLVSDTGNYFATNTSTMEEPQLLSNQNLGFDTRNYLFADNTSSMLLPHQSLDSLMVGHQLLSNHNMVFDPMNYSAPCTSSMQVGPQLLSNDQNVVFGPINHSASITSSMQVESQLLSNQNLVFDPMNNSAPCTSSMVGPQLLSNQNLVFDPINHYAPIASSMQVESQPLSNQNLVSDYSRNYLVPNTSSMVGHDQLLSNNNFFSDPRNHFAPNTCLMVHPQVAELFAQFTALLGRYLLNQSLVSAPQWQINPQQGSYSSLYSNGDFGNNCTSSSSEFHRGLEDAWIAQGSFQDKHPEEATGQDFSY